MKNYNVYLSGDILYGDDFTEGEIEQWYEDEQDAYTNLYIQPILQKYHYKYHYLDNFHAWRRVSDRTYRRTLDIGSAMGHEFILLIERGIIGSIKIIEPSSMYQEFDNLEGVPTQWIKSTTTGKIDSENESYDLITCLSVLYHIPNVTYVMNACARVFLVRVGAIVIREAINHLNRHDGLNIELQIIGDGPLDSLMLGKMDRLPWLHYYGSIFDEQMISEISRACRFGCSPGFMGLNVVHMMSLSLPVVTHDKLEQHMGPEPEYFEHGKNGWLLERANDTPFLLSALRKL